MKINKFNKVGVYHSSVKEENQDYMCSIDEREFLVIMLADGATMCKKGLDGARLACEAMCQVLKQEGKSFFNYPKEKISYLLTEHILYTIEKNKEAEYALNEYGSTFSMVYMEKNTGRTVLINLGDGAIIINNKNGLNISLEPRKYYGNPCLTTTQGAHYAIEIDEQYLSLGDQIMLCSDGFLEQMAENELTALLEHYDLKQLNKRLAAVENMDDCSYICFKRERD